MSHELVSLRTLIASQAADLADLFRQTASLLAVPIEIIAVAEGAAANHALAGADLAYIDDALPGVERLPLMAALRAASDRPFSILLAAAAAKDNFDTDALADRPSRLEEARRLLERSSRLCLPTRVLVVDDSATMRSIVRKTLGATRFDFHVTEAAEGFAALALTREAQFDLVFLDCNLPGFSGLDTLAEFKREKRAVNVIMISSAEDTALAERARSLGAGFLKKPFFPADIEAALCGYYGLRALNPRSGY